ncbi:hypothetical protein [Achromobacter sp. Marseille-Q4962]|uniref:hypothetical protein n=1 Tax=Achromobacter sp. Marseille-Q4962 TaxID=2942202 RepID=UPI002073F3D8|nr:hypothetical protein [Achromobacter sp. Marseille-Q4962]
MKKRFTEEQIIGVLKGQPSPSGQDSLWFLQSGEAPLMGLFLCQKLDSTRQSRYHYNL